MGDMNDSLGNFNPSSITGGPSFVDALGRKACQLDGSSYANLGTTNWGGKITNAFSMSSHFYLTKRHSEAQGIICCYHGDWWMSGLILHIGEDDKFHYMVASGQGKTGDNQGIIYLSKEGVPEVTLNEWHNLCLVFNGSYIYMYVDSKFIASKSSKTINYNNRYYFIGRLDYSDRNFVGMMSSTAVWNRALTDSEVSMLWNGGNGLVY